jgi:hypothetical protein
VLKLDQVAMARLVRIKRDKPTDQSGRRHVRRRAIRDRDYISKKPRRKAIVTAWVRSFAPSLLRMLRM